MPESETLAQLSSGECLRCISGRRLMTIYDNQAHPVSERHMPSIPDARDVEGLEERSVSSVEGVSEAEVGHQVLHW